MAEESTAKKVADQFEDIVRDLFNIEVNTILRDKITAQKMPGVRHALMDIGVEYFEVLEKAEKAYRDKYPPEEHPKKYNTKYPYAYRVKNDKWWVIRDIPPNLGFFYKGEESKETQKEYETAQKEKKERGGISNEIMMVNPRVCEHLGGFEAFAIMRRWADKFLQDVDFLQHLRGADDPDKKNLDEKKRILSVLPRIKENADMLKGMFSRLCRHKLEKNGQLKDEKGNPLTLAGVLEERANESKEKGQKEWELTPETVVQVSEEIARERTKSLTNQYTRSEIISKSSPLEPEMDHSDLVMVRKIWEVGTEVIAMQTTIQVDGDVITRLNPNYLDDKLYEKLSAYHKDGVNLAMRHWGTLISVAKGLMERVSRGLWG